MIRRTYRIALAELRVLFFSPMAWLVLLIFLVESAFLFTGVLKHWLVFSETGGEIEGSLTAGIFGKWGLLGSLSQQLYLFIPFLTMGLMSREYQSGSVKLLFSSPVKDVEVILGKFLGIFAFVVLLVATLSLFIVSIPLIIGHVDIGLLFGGLIGLILLGGVYAAIGLFLSCLTSYQVVAAIATFVFFAAISNLHDVGQDYAWIRDITYYLDVSARTDHFLTGLVVSRDVFYFLLMMLSFLGWSWIYVRGLRRVGARWVKAMSYALVPVLILAIGSVTSDPRWVGYWDLTANKSNTVSPDVVKALEAVKGKVDITTYVNVLDGHSYLGWPSERNRDKEFFEGYQRFLSAPLDLKYVYYYGKSDSRNSDDPTFLKSEAQRMLEKRGMEISDVLTANQVNANLSTEKGRFVRILRNGHDSATLRVFDDMLTVPFEKEVAAAFQRLNGVRKTAVFLYGHGERSIYNLDGAGIQVMTSDITGRDALVNNGFDVAQWSPDSADVPVGTDVMVIAAPKTPFSAQALNRLKAYVDAGGNMLVLTEPGGDTIVNPILGLLSIRQLPGNLLQQSSIHEPSVVVASVMAPAGTWSSPFKIPGNNDSTVMFKGVAPVVVTSPSAFTVTPIVETNVSTDGYLATKYNPDSGSMAAVPRDGKMAYPIALTAKRLLNGKEQRIMVMGDVDWMGNEQIKRNMDHMVNDVFLLKVFRWVSGDVLPVDTYRSPDQDTTFYIGLDRLSTVRLLFLGIIPVCCFIAGVFILRRRRNR